jgi:3-dehydroquinate synthase
MPTTIRVALSGQSAADRSYDIEIGRGTLPTAGRFLRQRLPASRAVIIADQAVVNPHGERVRSALTAEQIRTDLVVVPSGEASKSIGQFERLCSELAALEADRKTVIVALGGGVVGDLAGFVAASFARGLALVQIPTTLLAQVDSSVGGKVGVNLPAAKNIVGAFWQPSGVLIDLDVLTTLPEREYRSGLAEVVKYGVILDADFFAYLETHVAQLIARDSEVLEHVVARCCRLKADVVERDERETTGLRAVLNYGHTFAHAIEAVSGYGTHLHGEAVAIGMVCASRLAERHFRVGPELSARQKSLLDRLGLPTTTARLDAAALLAAMHRDKKAEAGQLRFVLPKQLGQVELVGGIDDGIVREVIAG